MACVKLLLDMVAAQWPPLPTRVAACFPALRPGARRASTSRSPSFLRAAVRQAAPCSRREAVCRQILSPTRFAAAAAAAAPSWGVADASVAVVWPLLSLLLLLWDHHEDHSTCALLSLSLPISFSLRSSKKSGESRLVFFFFGINLKTHKTTTSQLASGKKLSYQKWTQLM